MSGQPVLHGPSIEWQLWSTRMRLVVAEPHVLAAAKQVVDNTLLRVERAVSRFDPDSEVRRLRAGRTTRVSSELAAILGATLDAADLTGGAIDPTLGNALVALGYDRDIARVRQRSTGISCVATPTTGWRRVELDRERRMLTVPAGTMLDLGALGKAWAADQAAAEVHELTGSPVLVSLGGDIATAGGVTADGVRVGGGGGSGAWNVLVRDVDTGPAALIGLPAGAAVATSSTRSRAWVAGGRLLHHILDPRHGIPARLGPGHRARFPYERPRVGCRVNELLWLVGRGTGVAALVFLTVSVSLGILTARRWGTPETPRFAVTEIHRRASLGASLLLLVHVVTLVLDSRSGLRLMDVLVPFVSTGNAFWYGLGTLGLELLAVLVVSSLLRKHLPYAVWRGLHWLAYLCWPVAFAHGIGVGSDAGSAWMLLVSGACLVLVMWSVTTRLLGTYATGPAVGPPSRRGRTARDAARPQSEAGMS